MKKLSYTNRFEKTNWLRVLGAMVIAATFVSTARAAQSVTLAWDPSPDSSVVGYVVYYGLAGGSSTNSLDAANQTTATVSNLTPGSTEFFYVKSYNSQRVESLPSNLITYTLPVANTPPTISSIANRTINEDTTSGAIAFTVGDTETTAGSLTVSGSSSNPTLVPNASIVFGGSGGSRTVTVTPSANQSGTATITVTVSDGTASTSTSFALTVSPVNDPPTISSIANRTISAGGTTGAIAFTVGDVETAAGSLTVSGSSSNPTLVPNANIVFGGSGSSRTVSVTPAAGQSGTATITVTVNDGSASAGTSFALTVNATANTAPTISSIADQVIAANTATTSIAFTIGDAETSATSLTLSPSSSNPTLVPNGGIVFGGSGSTRTVTVTPAIGQSGTATITVSVSDGSLSASRSFLLTVSPAAPQPFIYLPFEAELGVLFSPMAILAQADAGQGSFIQSLTDGSGTATYSVNIPLSGNYTIWCRVLSPSQSQDSFYVSVDGGAEYIYATAENKWTNVWQWTAVNALYELGTTSRVFPLTAGTHQIVFRSREANTGLDQLLITNDPNYVPDAIFSISAAGLRISSIKFDPSGFATLSWPTVPGKSYRVSYKTKLSDTSWKNLGAALKATDVQTSKSDYAVGNRFYRIEELP